MYVCICPLYVVLLLVVYTQYISLFIHFGLPIAYLAAVVAYFYYS